MKGFKNDDITGHSDGFAGSRGEDIPFTCTHFAKGSAGFCRSLFPSHWGMRCLE